MVAHAILSPDAVYLYLYMYVQVWVHLPGDPQCSDEECYNNNNIIRYSVTNRMISAFIWAAM